MVFICAVTRPDPEHDFDGRIGIGRVCVIREAHRTAPIHQRGEGYEVDINIDSEWCQNWYVNGLLSAVKEKMTRAEP